MADPSEPLPTPDRSVPPAGPAPRVRPRFRGVVHQWSFFGALAAGAALVIWAPAGRATAACAVYAVALAGLLGTSALYHRGTWRPGVRAWLRRLDHSMIFVLIAGTYTPFAVLVLEEPLSAIVLGGVWGGAAAGIVFTLVWIEAPKWLTAACYVALGWFSVIAFPQIVERAGAGALALLAAGGLAYTAGAVVYARRRPDPRPASFGYHEVFHVLVVAAAVAHFIAVAAFAVPLARSG
jgi:hemolysin III